MMPTQIEPVYVTKDGTKIPYLPEHIVTARDAYSATLHVLFRHVSDFHLSVVSAISKKYGIPEDEIMETIHESEEFKRLTPDPALVTIFDNVEVEIQSKIQECEVTDSSQSAETIPAQTTPAQPVREKTPPKKVILKKKPKELKNICETTEPKSIEENNVLSDGQQKLSFKKLKKN